MRRYCLLPTAYYSRGFTIVETLVAITIIAIAMAGPFYSIQNALTYSYVARDQLIAGSLAQEAIEYIRFRRDNAFLANPATSWATFLSGVSLCMTPPASTKCLVDVMNGASGTVSSGASPTPLYIDSNNLYNQQSSGVRSRFTRTVQLTTISATQIRVDVTVSWNTAKTAYSMTLTDYLHDWI